ncbi:amidohydrolase family protein [Achromobacter veterisilvae]|jgi:imidazolonepropionase-like amidohydrolase|uniref:Amidohydrolase family protein n=1 Tax=Achromobacter veterisilvae TaxID=2069367 RepID=A0A446CGV3_9BURK|nr:MULTISPECIES: amidohydrolase family protein [Achromobacter]MCW0206139.1 amidohydrolase family protein [Achromobacter sp.]SSW67055.1 Imidazolonepropionase [Achromobacter veterisilvae]
MNKKGYLLKGRVIDGTLDAPIERGIVVTEGEHIAWVGESGALPAHFAAQDYEVVELPGRSIMPGLIDGHTHISFGESRSEEENALYSPVEFRSIKAIYNAKKILQAGVTSAFDAATTYAVAQAVRDAIESGMFPGPRYTVSGRQITNHQGLEDAFPSEMAFPPGQAAVLVKTRDDLVEAVRLQVKDCVDAIKVSGSNDNLITPDSADVSAFTVEELKIIADETHRLGKICSIHARSRISARDAALAGFDNLFHASYIDEAGIEACLKSGSVITPTLTLLVNLIEANQASAGASGAAAFQREVDAARKNLRQAYDAGVPLLAGSESGWSPVPYGQWHAREMEIFVKLLGLTPLQAIHSNTLAVTRLLSPRYRDKVGKLEKGRYADILVLPGDPTKDITLLQRPGEFDYILQGGKPVDRIAPNPRRRMWYERTKTFLSGLYVYDEANRRGNFLPE